MIEHLALSPRKALIILLAISPTSWVAPATAGTIVGTVHAEKPAGSESSASAGGNYASRRYKFLERVDYDHLSGFIVFVDGIDHPAPPDSPPIEIITQKDGTFVPRITPVVVGTAVDWPNLDDIFHNVFSMSETTPFDLGLYKKHDQAKRVKFQHRGRIDVFCSIHTKMNCVVLVLPNPWFARADARGRFVIENVPAGKHQLKAWHERLPTRIVEITVPETGEVSVAFKLGLGGLPKM